MNSLLKKTLISIITLLPALQPAVARDIITEQPAGEVIEYYADFQNFDNLFGFMGDYHSVQKIVFADDNTVYFPNLLLARTMPAYVKGQYDKTAKTITVEAGQWVFLFPNKKIPVALYMLDAKGNAGETSTTFYSQPLVFDVAEDGVITLRSSDEFPMFGICNADNSEEVYQNAKDLRFTPVKNVNDKLTRYNYSYVYNDETNATQTTAAAYKEGDDILWVKGFVPKYPDSWVKIEKTDGAFFAKSFQVQSYFSSEDPIVFAAYDGTDLLTALPVAVDETTGKITAANAAVSMCTATSDGSNFEVFIVYSDLTLTQTELRMAKPAAPVFVSYDGSSSEKEFIFSAKATDTAGDALPQDCLSFQLYIDGAPYIFTTADYKWISADMPVIPYTFDNYNFFSKGSDNKRYVYLQNMSDDVKTIGVETVYTVDGQTYASNRLTYDIVSGKATTVIEDIAIDSAEDVKFFNLQGQRVANPENGKVYIRVQGDKATKVAY